MNAVLVLVWVGSSASLGAHQADLDGWATSRQVRIEEAAPEPTLMPAAHDDALADRIEALLAQARAEAFSASPSGAAAALDAAEKLLERAPELPENAFLMAEAYHQRALLLSDGDPAAARALEARAVALAGPRSAPFSSSVTPPAARTGGGPPAAAEVRAGPAPAGATNQVPLEGPLPDDEVEIDGVEVHGPPTLPDGAHHVRVLRGGRLAWAGWVAVGSEAVRAPVPRPAACSTADLLPRPGAEGHRALCERYAIARPAGTERIEVALCRHSVCGEFLPWSRAWGATFEGPVHSPRPVPSRHSWILWTVVGVAAAAVGGVVLVESGAFDRRGPTRETLTFVPPK